MYTGQIPFDWFKASQYFITYWGEIFFGKVFLLQGYDDRFFIIQNDKIKEISDGPQTLERYQQLGREIKDFNVIKDVRADLGQEYPWSNLNHKGNYKKMFVFGAAASTYCVFGEKAAQFRNAEIGHGTTFD